ncbi:hypothetical protein DYB32_010334 [Aphanomyces invadans]|uniref:Tc1-like transposase DDE domain-containing protein n=1 Tax=Aphanomyces invadans TaxID=157072 RepID=A0A418AG33_9STRA|nr:hypothetical protein DYB32_010334 [Aphanomyces invadans]
MDGAKIHCHPDIVTYLRDLGIVPLFLPAYCPFYNPIEYLFGYLKKSFQRNYSECRTENNLVLFVDQIIQRFKKMDMSNDATGMRFVGTGGTVGGVSRFLKEQNQSFQVWHFDPIEGGASSDYVNTKQSTIGPDGFEFILKRDGATVSRVVVRVLPALKLAMDA